MARLQAGQKPDFVAPSRAANLALVSWQTDEPSHGVGAAGKLQAVLAGEGSFRLYSATKELGEEQLPVYADGMHRTDQVLRTPFAIAADIITVATVVVLIAWASGGWNSY